MAKKVEQKKQPACYPGEEPHWLYQAPKSDLARIRAEKFKPDRDTYRQPRPARHDCKSVPLGGS